MASRNVHSKDLHIYYSTEVMANGKSAQSVYMYTALVIDRTRFQLYFQYGSGLRSAGLRIRRTAAQRRYKVEARLHCEK
mgnify:CR=1 FL=1